MDSVKQPLTSLNSIKRGLEASAERTDIAKAGADYSQDPGKALITDIATWLTEFSHPTDQKLSEPSFLNNLFDFSAKLSEHDKKIQAREEELNPIFRQMAYAFSSTIPEFRDNSIVIRIKEDDSEYELLLTPIGNHATELKSGDGAGTVTVNMSLALLKARLCFAYPVGQEEVRKNLIVEQVRSWDVNARSQLLRELTWQQEQELRSRQQQSSQTLAILQHEQSQQKPYQQQQGSIKSPVTSSRDSPPDQSSFYRGSHNPYSNGDGEWDGYSGSQ